MKLRHLPPRLATGAFILNSGLAKRDLDGSSAAGMQQMAANAFPQVTNIPPERFGKLLSRAEIGLGAALVLPFVPTWLAATGLTAFSGALLRMYLKTPGLTEADGVRPTKEGTPLAKDVFMFGSGLGLLLDVLTTPSSTKASSTKAKRSRSKARG